MAFIAPVFRRSNSLSCGHIQRRWAQVLDVRFLATQHVADKYNSRLDAKAQSEGFQSVEDLKLAYQEKIAAAKARKITPTQKHAIAEKVSPLPQASSTSKAVAHNGVKTLSSFLDVSKTTTLPQKEIEYIWRLRHASDPQSLCAIMSNDTYNRLETTAKSHPRFILPIPRENGAEIHFLQWTFPSPTTSTILFTHLAEYKLRGEFAQPHTTVTHHLDLQQEKQLVLLQGTVLPNRGVSVDDGKWLLMCMQKFYGGGHRKTLLEQFTSGDEAFRVEDVIAEADRLD